MYKLYIKTNGFYKDVKIYNTYEEAKSHAKGEYIIIKRENDTDEMIEHKEEDWER